MPAVAQYPTAWCQMDALASAALEAEVAFADFWEAAMRPGRPPITWRVPESKRPADAIVWPNDTQTRKDDQAAMNATREGWERAYLGRPQLRREAALPRLLSLMDRHPAEEGEGEGVGEAVLSAA